MLLGFLILIAVGALIESRSRTALIALSVSSIALIFDRLRTRKWMMTAVVIATLGLCGLFVLEIAYSGEFLSNKLISAITKSGKAEELTSATGRTEIWYHVIAAISERPLFGWGLDCAASVGLEAGSTHNLILNVTLSSGVFVGLLCIGLLSWTAWKGLRSDQPAIRAIAAYVLISGIVEDTVFESFPSILTILWIIFLLWTSINVTSTLGNNTGQGALA